MKHQAEEVNEDGSISPQASDLDRKLFELEYAKKYYSDACYNLELKISLLSEFSNSNSLLPLTSHLISHLPLSKAQLIQDLIVSYFFKGKGYFVEFGASDGIIVSNTFYLEKELLWRGILAEPSRKWEDALRLNRGCHIETACVYDLSRTQILFNETEDGLLSTISDYSDSDMHANLRKQGFQYLVNTISLEDLLKKFDAPKYIEFLSVDTEGSEWEILRHFDFDSYKFGAIFVEHNYGPNRMKIADLLSINGYKQILSQFSRWDDWFISSELYDTNMALFSL